MKVEFVELSKIVIVDEIQSRVTVDDDTVQEYAAAILGGAIFPPPQLFRDGDSLIVGDGVHRTLAHKIVAEKKPGQDTIEAHVFDGGRPAAVRCSIRSNHSHGLKRTNADKSRALAMALQMKDIEALPSREVAKIVGVSHSTVLRAREAMSGICSGDGDTPPLGLAEAQALDAAFMKEVREADANMEAAGRELIEIRNGKGYDSLDFETMEDFVLANWGEEKGGVLLMAEKAVREGRTGPGWSLELYEMSVAADAA